ncbi:MAG: tetratricopeptide repeat protein, partial [Pseudomonadota bacterium]
MAYLMRGVALYYLSRGAEAIGAAEQALSCFREISDRKEQASVHRLMGAVHRSQSNYAASLEHQTGALDIARSLRDAKNIASAQNNIALIFWELGSYERAYDEFVKVVAYYEQQGPQNSWLVALNNLALVLIELDRPAEALEHLVRGRGYAREGAIPRTRAYFESNIAFAYTKLDRSREALEHYESALAIREATNDLWGQTRALGAIGGLWWSELNEPEKARPYLERAADMAIQAGAARERAEVLRMLSEVYEALQQPVQALDVLRQSRTLYDALDVTAAEQQLRVLESAREVAEADLRLSQQARRQSLLIYVVLTMLLATAALLAYTRSRATLLARVRASRDALEVSAQSLRESEQRYRRLFDNAVVPKFLVDPHSGRLL